jgi:hypothetical protein
MRLGALTPMANIIIVNEKNARQVFARHDPYIWKCDSCGKERKYTQQEIDMNSKPWPDPENHNYDFYITCPVCGKGVMEPPTFVSFGEIFRWLDRQLVNNSYFLPTIFDILIRELASRKQYSV